MLLVFLVQTFPCWCRNRPWLLFSSSEPTQRLIALMVVSCCGSLRDDCSRFTPILTLVKTIFPSVTTRERTNALALLFTFDHEGLWLFLRRNHRTTKHSGVPSDVTNAKEKQMCALTHHSTDTSFYTYIIIPHIISDWPTPHLPVIFVPFRLWTCHWAA